MREFKSFLKNWGFILFLYGFIIGYILYTGHNPDPFLKLPATKGDIYFAMILIIIFGRK